MEKKKINVEVGSRIKKARLDAGLTQEQLAEMVNLSTKNISMVECGISGISLSTLQKLCVALDVSSDHLLFGSSEISDMEQFTKKLTRLTPSQLSLIKDILNRLLLSFQE